MKGAQTLIRFDLVVWEQFALSKGAGHFVTDGTNPCSLWRCRINGYDAVIGSSWHERNRIIELRAPMRLNFAVEGAQVEIEVELETAW